MGIVVGEPKLTRFRKDRKNPKANYYIYWTDSIEGSKELSTRASVYAKANKVFNIWRLKNIGVTSSRSIHEVLIDEILEYYHNAQIARGKSTERLKSSIKRLKPFWGDRAIGIIGSLTIRDYIDWRFELHEKLYPHTETISINTIRRELVDLRSAANKADKDRLIDRRVHIELPSEIKKGVESFSFHETKALILAAQKVRRARHHLPLFIKIGLLTGRRKMAILELKWADIDFDHNVIYWESNEPVRTNKRSPDAKLPPRLKRIFLRYRTRNPNDEYVISYQGKPIKNIKTSFSQAVDLARARISLEQDAAPSSVLPNAYPHMLRHTCATWQMHLGTEPRELCGFLGMTMDTLERRYWHHHPDFQKGAGDAFGSR